MFYEREWSNPNYTFLSYSVENLNWHLHFHESFEICYVLSNEEKITIGNDLYNLKKDEGVIIFPRQLHCYKSIGNSKMQVITFLPKIVPEFTKQYKNKIPCSSLIPDIKKYKAELNPKDIISQKGLLYSILGTLIANTKFNNISAGEDSHFLLKVLRFVENNYDADCSLSTASAQLSYGYSYLSRTFYRLMNMSYTEYLNKYRINRAVYMLCNEETVQIQEIAQKCGYESLCSFNRNFKAINNCTPSQMLKNLQKHS